MKAQIYGQCYCLAYNNSSVNHKNKDKFTVFKGPKTDWKHTFAASAKMLKNIFLLNEI